METRVEEELSLERLRACLAAAADVQRLRLLQMLRAGPRNVTELVLSSTLRQPLVSHHLGVLSRSGLVETERAGKYRIYRIAPRDSAAAAVLALVGSHFDTAPNLLPWEMDRSPRGRGVEGFSSPPAAIEDYLL